MYFYKVICNDKTINEIYELYSSESFVEVYEYYFNLDKNDPDHYYFISINKFINDNNRLKEVEIDWFQTLNHRNKDSNLKTISNIDVAKEITKEFLRVYIKKSKKN